MILAPWLFLGCQTPSSSSRSDALWNIIHTQCLPNQERNKNPAPCEEVSFLKGTPHGYVILKDRNGPLQHLLMPTEKIKGIESVEILATDAPHYFYQAWLARSYLSKKYQSLIEDEDISLAVNSSYGRSQHQLHIHISCVRPDVKKKIHENSTYITARWSLLPNGLLGHAYFARRLSSEQFRTMNSFAMLAQDLPGAAKNMGSFGMALLAVRAGIDSEEFILLADQADLTKGDRASVEEIQDHRCPQLYPAKNM